jgi:ribosome modulation factor
MSSPTPPTPAQAAIYAAGRQAYDAGRPLPSCPHTGGESRTLWVRGWVQAETAAKYPEG